ncbi:MAG TPA: methyltransferase domain-containing protein [Polyangiaceae bacterium]|nr:methyltransferase domain-containing protein [Polyangiaceae bacterium]
MSTLHPDSNTIRSLPAPRYAEGRRRGSFLARFGGGPELEVEPGRVRAYPGLRGEAPSMAAYYEAFAEFVKAGRVLDAGSGAGMGTYRLLARGLEVVAVDIDPRAVAFAEQQAPGAEHVVTDLAALEVSEPVDGAILADVLCHTLDPESVLLAIGRALKPGASLLVAEPRAHVSQRLSAPQRRAFSAARLKSLLLRTGFDVEGVISDRVPFVCLLAKKLDAAKVCEAFGRAYAFSSQGKFNAAVASLQAARAESVVTVATSATLEILLAQFELFLASGDGDKAASTCFEARELFPNDARPLIGLGRIALASGGASDALSLALEALRHDATEPSAYALAGVSANELGHPDAFTAFRAAVHLAPDDPLIVQEFVRLCSERGAHSLGLASLDQFERYAVSSGPDQALGAEHHILRASLLIAAGRPNEAEVELRIARMKGADPTELTKLEQALSRGRPQ